VGRCLQHRRDLGRVNYQEQGLVARGLCLRDQRRRHSPKESGAGTRFDSPGSAKAHLFGTQITSP
jgi:hypothetical protein